MASQIITLSLADPSASFGVGEQVVVNVTYDVDTGATNLTGIGIRIHFDNTELQFDGADVAFTQSLFGPVNESSELGNDNDPETNRIVNWRYFDLFGTWTNTALPLTLGTLTFTTLSEFDGTNLNVTFASNAAGFDGVGNTLALDLAVPQNQAPVSNPESYTMNRSDGVLTVPVATGVLSNDSDADGDALTAILWSVPSGGSLEFDADGSFVYTPASGFVGTGSVQLLSCNPYKARD